MMVAGLQCVLLRTQKPWSQCVRARVRLSVLRSAIHGIRVELLKASLGLVRGGAGGEEVKTCCLHCSDAR